MAGASAGDLNYFKFLTNWAHIAYNSYLITAALSTTVKAIMVHCSTETVHSSNPRCKDYFGVGTPSGYWNLTNNRLSWYQMLQWVLFTIGNEGAFVVLVLYWSLIFHNEKIDGVNANTHLLNGILSIVDVWVTGLPVNLVHFIYLTIFSTIYSMFAGVYYIASENIIYAPLNYKDNAGGAVGLCLLVSFLVLPLLHSAVYVIYLCRQWLVRHVHALRLGGGGGGVGGGAVMLASNDDSQPQDIELVGLRERISDSS